MKYYVISPHECSKSLENTFQVCRWSWPPNGKCIHCIHKPHSLHNIVNTTTNYFDQIFSFLKSISFSYRFVYNYILFVCNYYRALVIFDICKQATWPVRSSKDPKMFALGLRWDLFGDFSWYLCHPHRGQMCLIKPEKANSTTMTGKMIKNK